MTRAHRHDRTSLRLTNARRSTTPSPDPVGAVHGSRKMRRTALNRIQLLLTVASDLLESCFHRSERSLILVDTVEVISASTRSPRGSRTWPRVPLRQFSFAGRVALQEAATRLAPRPAPATPRSSRMTEYTHAIAVHPGTPQRPDVHDATRTPPQRTHHRTRPGNRERLKGSTHPASRDGADM
jgi:hypothetical protein